MAMSDPGAALEPGLKALVTRMPKGAVGRLGVDESAEEEEEETC